MDIVKIVTDAINFIQNYWILIVLAVVILALIIERLFGLRKNKTWQRLKKTIFDFIIGAEQTGANGVIKKEIVMSKIRDYCAKNKIPFDEKTFSELIDEYIDFTKTVNPRDKDKDNTDTQE